MNAQRTIARSIPSNPIVMMYRLYRYILPDVSAQLKAWRDLANRIPDPELNRQAIASMTTKRFHCQGGAVYATGNLEMRHVLVPLIVAYQTISDYLDNLCDRSTSQDPKDFRMLHQSMLDALDPEAPLHDYYAYHKEKDDGGYLAELVKTCQSCVLLLPSYACVMDEVQRLAALYIDLQVYKHIQPERREQALLDWWQLHKEDYGGIKWNEFAAAAGSTLGIFMLFLASSEAGLTEDEVILIREAYFPYVCGLHILLDYLIDQEEDRIGGDLNFCSYYSSFDQAAKRIRHFALQARNRVGELKCPSFHRMVIEGLLALYLSDPKVKHQQDVRHVSKTLMKNSPLTRIFFLVNSVWIRFQS